MPHAFQAQCSSSKLAGLAANGPGRQRAGPGRAVNGPGRAASQPILNGPGRAGPSPKRAGPGRAHKYRPVQASSTEQGSYLLSTGIYRDPVTM